MPEFCGTGCIDACDFCQFYRFNGDEHGAYLNTGECAHPEHPHAEEPFGGCDDFVCFQSDTADPAQVAAAKSAQRKER
jgi:hypothetical protein